MSFVSNDFYFLSDILNMSVLQIIRKYKKYNLRGEKKIKKFAIEMSLKPKFELIY